MKIAVTGAAGFLGLNLVNTLLAEGHDVLAIDRVPGTPPAGAHGDGLLRWESVDVLDEEAMTRALDGIGVVHHLVAVISLRQEDPLAWRVNVDGVGAVARAALRAGVRRMVSCGSLASFHYERRGTVHEGSPRSTAKNLPVYHRSKYYGEVELLKVVDAGLDALICNPTGIYGPVDHPDRLSRLNQSLLDSARGKMPAGVSGEFDMVDVRDVARGFLLAAEKGRTGHNYLLGGHRYGLMRSMQDAAELAGATGPRITIPVGLLERVAPLIDPVARRFGSESFAPAALENVAMSPVVDRTKAGAELGYEPRPVEETIRDLVTFFAAEDLLERTPTR
ncbi:NAD-dependent epimerase/dehydratase family protein [Marmoricola sp. RAF53]|uniref:NAD-dependent epimerase/dehydratase family protein n=1 Tax=Marmoricola sp. RAF53 TaxID=3233059 RepID=UPI003F96E14F